MPDPRSLCIVYTTPIPVEKAEFHTNIPIRMKSMLGDSVDLHVLYNGEINERRLRDAGIKVRKVRFSPVHGKHNPLNFLSLAFETWSLARTDTVSVFMNASMHQFLFVPGIGARIAGKSLVGRVTGLRPPQARSVRQWLRKRIGNGLSRASIGMSDKSICLSHDLRSRLLDVGVDPEKLVVLSQGVDLDRFPFGRDREPRPARRILFVGRVVHTKGIREALHAYSTLHPTLPGLTFTVSGDGPLLPSLRNEYGAIPGVHFTGGVPVSSVPELYRNADILLLPSDSEGLPNVILEAMAAGVGVVASRVGENELLLGYGRRGILVRPRDTPALSAAIRRFHDDPKYHYSCVQEGRRYVEQEHGFDVLSQRYADLLYSVRGS
jgi:glycosyltransferase involved in cell wall biosynthesis